MTTTTPAQKRCPECAEQINQIAMVCRFCGYRFDGRPRTTKSPGLAAILTFLWWGLGHIYAGRLWLGIYLLVFDLLAFIATIASAFAMLLVVIPYAVWTIVHAYRTVEDINTGRKPRSAKALVLTPYIALGVITFVVVMVAA